MKVLSVRQPWAWLLANADSYPDPKRVENRTWKSSYRGQLLIHAGKTFDMDGYLSIIELGRPDLKTIMPVPSHYELGGIVGICTMVACVERYPGYWYCGPFGFIMESAAPLPFVPMRGALGFFDMPIDFKVPQ